MREPIPLFSANDLAGQLRARQDKVRLAVDNIPEDQFLISSDQEIIEFAVTKYFVEPLALREDAKTMTKTESLVDVSGDPMRHFPSKRSNPIYVFGTRVEVNIPFTGEEWLLQFRTSSFSDAIPYAEVDRNTLRISISLPHDADPE